MPDRPLGRDTRATQAAIGQIKASIPPAPRLFAGVPPRRSPNLSRFRCPRTGYQSIGSCVGWSGSAMAATSVRTPDPLTPESEPGFSIDFSPLWVYSIARAKSRDHGIRLGGEGAIVSHALEAVVESGFIAWEQWPANPQTERAYRDGRVPAEAAAARQHKPIGKVARLESADQVLEYLAAGYSVWIGVPWRGGSNTRPDGSFDWGRRSIGGHAVELLGYDLDADRVWVGNSWPQWGVGPCVGHTRWTDLAREFSDRALASGQSEACVVSEVAGEWAPKVRSWEDVP